MMVKPVALPPGRAKLPTKPLPTGSATMTKMDQARFLFGVKLRNTQTKQSSFAFFPTRTFAGFLGWFGARLSGRP
jgi:hypothetical protein